MKNSRKKKKKSQGKTLEKILTKPKKKSGKFIQEKLNFIFILRKINF